MADYSTGNNGRRRDRCEVGEAWVPHLEASPHGEGMLIINGLVRRGNAEGVYPPGVCKRLKAKNLRKEGFVK